MKNFIIYSSLIVLLIAIVTYIDNSVNIPKITPYPQFKSRLGNLQSTISIMTYNIRFNFLDSNKQSWEYRKEKLLNNIKLSNPEVTLFMIIELVGSTCFNSILYKEPLPIEEYKPYLYRTIRNLIKDEEIKK